MTNVAHAASQVGRKRWTRLIPVAIIVYIISFMDRTNIGFALNGLHKDLGIDAAQQGLAAGIFFIGYLTLQIPGGYLAERWSAKKFVGIMVLVWGVLAVLSGFVQNFEQLLIVRFFLGVAEAGIWPAILVLISHWFPEAERARAYAFWMMNIAIASIITAPLSGWILSFSDWRWLFIIEGIFPFVIAAPIWWLFVADHPRTAKWCSPEERAYIEEGLAADRAAHPAKEHVSIKHVFSNSVVWRLTLVYFLIQIGFYGLNIWLPKVVKTITGGSPLEVGFVTAIPYILAMVGLWYNAKAADKTGRYSRHVLLSMAIGAVALVISVATGNSMPIIAVVFISIAMAGALAYDGPFWASASRAMPVAVAGTAMGLINAVGNLGGFVGPYVGGFLQDLTNGSFMAMSVFLAACLLAAGLVMLTLRRGGDRPVTEAAEPEVAQPRPTH
ncbi:MFS transporter [Paenarthrobacter sp. DKR-5]|uniref:MFS transporter n=1 Tax=Paenarthrobacter sp. DKR-5 TaxID=2835535 RepID=UPI001BDC143A|nr:MFS transporter [Paenarthrobacter sp. DKR-5]MBT1001989.1 MFS transporter [Paenarthrobacter sp. DKR-5]